MTQLNFKNLDKLIKSKCICALEEYLDKKCDETEALYRFNPKQAHKRIKELKCNKFTNSSGICIIFLKQFCLKKMILNVAG